MTFVVAQPPSGVPSAIGLVVDCGITSLVPDGGGLLLRGQQPNLTRLTDATYPPIRFDRRGQRFYADDLPLLRHFCNPSGSQQPFGFLANEERRVSDRADLVHLEIDSRLGTIGIRRQVLIALTPEQCDTLRDARYGRPDETTEPQTSLAEVTGLDPPDGADDWYLTCQYP